MSKQRHLVRDWPPILPTVVAAEYCSVSCWSIQRAVARGELKALGVRGRTRVFHRDDLDRWMTGGTKASVSDNTSEGRSDDDDDTLSGTLP